MLSVGYDRKKMVEKKLFFEKFSIIQKRSRLAKLRFSRFIFMEGGYILIYDQNITGCKQKKIIKKIFHGN